MLVKQGAGVSNAIYDMHVCDTIELVGITGHGFALDEQKQRDLVFVAMGTGVAPLRSALRHVLKRKDQFGQWWCFMARARLMTFVIVMKLTVGKTPAWSCGG